MEDLMEDLMRTRPWLVLFANHTAMLVVSVLVMAVATRGDLARFGFRAPSELPVRQIVVWGLAIGTFSTLIAAAVPGKESAVSKELTLVQTVVFIWFWASVCEEVFVRGLVQTALAPLGDHGLLLAGLRISAPVVIAALFFGLMHLAQVAMGADTEKAMVIVLFAVALGLVAGYYREATGSLVPAIMVHAIANIGGSATEYVTGVFS